VNVSSEPSRAYSPSFGMSNTDFYLLRTTPDTTLNVRLEFSGSYSRPSVPSAHAVDNVRVRTKLPLCVVRIRSVLRFTGKQVA